MLLVLRQRNATGVSIVFEIVVVTNPLRCLPYHHCNSPNMADDKARPRRHEFTLYLRGYSICTLKLSQLFVSFASFGRNQFPYSR